MPTRPDAVRPAAVAGLFYPATAAALAREVDDALAQARHASLLAPKALIVPHAGYVYSGGIAAQGYARLRASAASIRRVVILGPCHRAFVSGLAVPAARRFVTPLGTVDVDAAAMAAIESLPQVVRSEAAHAHEHSIEVQVPFLQRLLGTFTIVPLAVGDASAEQVGAVLDRVWGGPETLIVVSSDLSHYHRYDEARLRDAATVSAILRLDGRIDHEQACGATPIAGLLDVARRRGLRAELVGRCNSGDTAGDRERVVGYAAFAFVEGRQRSRDDLEHADAGTTLLGLARGTIDQALGGPPVPPLAHEWLDAAGASFVTLRQRQRLRGCVGSLAASRPLRDDVAINARAAALCDPRFPPLRRDELAHTRIEVSLLDPAEALSFHDRDSLLAQLVVGADGLIVSSGAARATFLPQVWEMLPDPSHFVDELMRKGGLPASTPLTACTFERYRVRKWREADVQ